MGKLENVIFPKTMKIGINEIK